MKSSLAILALLCVAMVPPVPSMQAQQQQTNSITVAWEYNPPDGLSNYVFLVRSTSTISEPLPWQVIASVTGVTQVSVSAVITNWQWRFFYATATDQRNGPTNYVGESPPSSMVTTRLIPGPANTTIQRGP